MEREWLEVAVPENGKLEIIKRFLENLNEELKDFKQIIRCIMLLIKLKKNDVLRSV